MRVVDLIETELYNRTRITHGVHPEGPIENGDEGKYPRKCSQERSRQCGPAPHKANGPPHRSCIRKATTATNTSQTTPVIMRFDFTQLEGEQCRVQDEDSSVVNFYEHSADYELEVWNNTLSTARR